MNLKEVAVQWVKSTVLNDYIAYGDVAAAIEPLMETSIRVLVLIQPAR